MNLAAEIYVSPRRRALTPDETRVRTISYGIKEGVWDLVYQAAYAMAPLVPPGCVIVPAPGHLPGQPGPGTTDLAHEIAALTGGVACSCVFRRNFVQSSRERRLSGLPGLSPQEHADSMEVVFAPPPGEIVLVDNVLVSGATFAGMRRVLQQDALGVAYSQAGR